MGEVVRYFHAPLESPPDNLFTTPDHYVNKDPLWIGELTKEQYEQAVTREDEFGLPI